MNAYKTDSITIDDFLKYKNHIETGSDKPFDLTKVTPNMQKILKEVASYPKKSLRLPKFGFGVIMWEVNTI
jgi:hypothetical protein